MKISIPFLGIHVVLAISTVFCAQLVLSESFEWVELPLLERFENAQQMNNALSEVYTSSEYDLLVIADNLVFGNSCASFKVGGASNTTGIGGASETDSVGGASETSSLSGASGFTSVTGAGGQTNTHGASGLTGVGGTSSSTAISGSSQTTSISGTSESSATSGTSDQTSVWGAFGSIKCARTSDKLDYVYLVPLSVKIYEFDGLNSYIVMASKIHKKEDR